MRFEHPSGAPASLAASLPARTMALVLIADVGTHYKAAESTQEQLECVGGPSLTCCSRQNGFRRACKEERLCPEHFGTLWQIFRYCCHPVAMWASSRQTYTILLCWKSRRFVLVLDLVTHQTRWSSHSTEFCLTVRGRPGCDSGTDACCVKYMQEDVAVVVLLALPSGAVTVKIV